MFKFHNNKSSPGQRNKLRSSNTKQILLPVKLQNTKPSRSSSNNADPSTRKTTNQQLPGRKHSMQTLVCTFQGNQRIFRPLPSLPDSFQTLPKSKLLLQ